MECQGRRRGALARHGTERTAGMVSQRVEGGLWSGESGHGLSRQVWSVKEGGEGHGHGRHGLISIIHLLFFL